MNRIMKKFLAGVLVGLMVSGASVMTASAVLIDGTIGSGEWAGASVFTIGNGGGTAYLMADENYAYGAFDITGWTAAMGSGSHGNLLGFGVWGANNGYPVNGVEFAQSLPGSGTLPGYSGTLNGLDSAFSLSTVVQGSIPGDLQAMASFATGHRVWEVMMPISSMFVSEGDSVYFVGGINYEGAQHWYPNTFGPPTWGSYAPVKVQAGTSVPDGGMTLGLLGLALTGLAGLRRKLSL
jgi:hypothetical protein